MSATYLAKGLPPTGAGHLEIMDVAMGGVARTVMKGDDRNKCYAYLGYHTQSFLPLYGVCPLHTEGRIQFLNETSVYVSTKLSLWELLNLVREIWMMRANFQQSGGSANLEWFKTTAVRELPADNELRKWLDEEKKAPELLNNLQTFLDTWFRGFCQAGSSYGNDGVTYSLPMRCVNAIVRIFKYFRFIFCVKLKVMTLPAMQPWDFGQFKSRLEDVFATRIHGLIKTCYELSSQEDLKKQTLTEISQICDSPRAIRQKFLLKFHKDKIEPFVAQPNQKKVSDIVEDIQTLSRYWEIIKDFPIDKTP